VETIKYTPGLDIRNVGALPAGLGCKFLLCIRGEGGALIAKSWHRKMPKTGGDVVVCF